MTDSPLDNFHRREVPELAEAWQAVLTETNPNFQAWLTSAKPLTVHESTMMIAVPNEFTRERIETRMRPEIEEVLSDLYSRSMRLAITIEPGLELALKPAEPADDEPIEIAHFVAKKKLKEAEESGKEVDEEEGLDVEKDGVLNQKYTFDNFVIGSSNQFAHAAAMAVAESPGKSYNPLMIYGGSGLGKTHLLHAVGHYVRSYYENVRVKYVTTEEMTNHFINAISANQTNEFRRIYREVDVLLIDDIQFLESKIQTQEEFFHTFNTLHNAQKQIVMTSDRPPKALAALETRLRSRFEWGLITDIQPPDLETRIAILRRRAINQNLQVSPKVLEFIAENIRTNIRELEGALARVTAYASLNRQPLDVSLAQMVLKDFLPAGGAASVSAQVIMSETANYFGVTIEELCSTSRTQTLVTARQIAMYLCRELTEMSLPKIGAEFGGKDHTTVMHAVKKINRTMSERRTIFNQVSELTNRIKNNNQ